MMTLDELRACCLAQHAAEETMPFGPDVVVYKVMDKMFALLPPQPPIDRPVSIALKCNPYVGQMLRENYTSITPAWHMNKAHWIDVQMDGSVPDPLIREWIAESWALVVRGLTRAQKAQLASLARGERGEIVAGPGTG